MHSIALILPYSNYLSTVYLGNPGVILLALVIAAEGIFQFNRLQATSTTVQARRADVDRELKRRQNLIPGVVALAGRYANYEKGMVKYVSDARTVLQTIRNSQASGTEGLNALPRLYRPPQTLTRSGGPAACDDRCARRSWRVRSPLLSRPARFNTRRRRRSGSADMLSRCV